MDVAPYLELRPSPHALFDALPARRDRVRFMRPDGAGGFRPVTWGAFAGEIRHLALFLASELAPGDRAAIFAPNRVEWMSAALAIQSAGGVMVPIYASSTAAQLGFIAAHSESRVLFVDGEALLARTLAAWSDLGSVRRIVLLDDALDPIRALAALAAAGRPVPNAADVEARCVRFCRALALGAARDREEPAAFERALDAVQLEQGAVMLYTSGTTGEPKGVPLTHHNVAVNGRDWLEVNAPLLAEDDVDLLWLPMSHIFGFGEACLGNTLGFTTYLSDPASVLADLGRVRPTVFMSVPSIWEKLAARPDQLETATGGRLRFCLSGGAGLRRDVKELFHERGILIIEGYGLTECAPTLTLNRAGAFRFDSVGQPLPSVELRLDDDGEILARGPNVFAGYHRDPEATRAAFTGDGWFRTGDLGRFTADGFLQIVDRKKELLVTSGGKNIAPAPIEACFRDVPPIERVVVYGDGHRYLVAGVWLDPAAVDPHLDHAARRALVQERLDRINAELPRHETIKRFALLTEPLTVEAGLLTSTLKLRRQPVYARFRATLESLYDD